MQKVDLKIKHKILITIILLSIFTALSYVNFYPAVRYICDMAVGGGLCLLWLTGKETNNE